MQPPRLSFSEFLCTHKVAKLWFSVLFFNLLINVVSIVPGIWPFEADSQQFVTHLEWLEVCADKTGWDIPAEHQDRLEFTILTVAGLGHQFSSGQNYVAPATNVEFHPISSFHFALKNSLSLQLRPRGSHSSRGPPHDSLT